MDLIPKNIQNRIFEPLFSTKDDGFGLGLSFCYDIIARHRGVLESSTLQN